MPSQPTLVKQFLNRVLAAGGIDYLEVSRADHLFYYASTGAVGDLVFSFDDQQNAPLLIGQVVQAKTPFQRVVVQNSSLASITYSVVASMGVIDFKGLVIASNVTTQQLQTATGVFGALIDCTTTPKVFTAISNLAVILQADSANTQNVYIGFDNTVTAAKYVVCLQPGEKYVFSSYKGDLYAFASSATGKLAASYM